MMKKKLSIEEIEQSVANIDLAATPEKPIVDNNVNNKKRKNE